MASRRFKSAPYVRRQYLAFCVFGEITPYVTGYRRLIWHYEDGPPMERFAPTIELLEHEKEFLIAGDLEAYESYCRPGDQT